MRRWPTWLVLGTVCLLAVVAAADALRRADSRESTTTATRATLRGDLRGELRDEQIQGLVVYSDPECVVHSLLLPALERNDIRTEAGAPLRMCEFSAAGGRFLAPGEVLSPNRELIARCRGGQVEVVDASSGEERESVSGCPSAWHPDGCLTHVSAGEIQCGARKVLSEVELLAVAQSHPNVADAAAQAIQRVTPTALAWLDPNVLAVALEITIRSVEPQYLLALLERGRVLGWSIRFDGPMRDLEVSPRGSMVAAEGTIVMTRNGNELALPGPLVGEVLGWSPDDRWIVIAGQASVYLVRALHLRAVSPTPRTIRLPIVARSFVWTGSSLPTGSSTVG
jgi:hypothetical protein